MAGARVEFTTDTVSPALKRGIAAMTGEGRTLLLGHLGEYLMRSTRERAAQEIDPSGKKWKALSPGYAKWKAKKRPGVPILKFDFHMLGDQFAHQVDGDVLYVGTNAPYGARHQFGGTFKQSLKPGKVRLRTDARGNLLRQGEEGNAARLAVFAKRKHKRAVERSYAGRDYNVTTPARPWLGISADDVVEIGKIVKDHLGDAFTAE